MVSARRSARRRRSQAAVAIAAAWRVTGKSERGAWCSAIDWLEVCPGVEGANAWGATAGQERSARTAVWRRCWAEWRERGGLRCDTGSGLSGGDAMMQRSGQA